MSLPLLSLVTFLPLVGIAFILLFVRNKDVEVVNHNTRCVALLTTLATFFVSLLLPVYFASAVPGFQLIERHDWIEGSGISYHMGVDGISLLLILLTTLLAPICVLVSWKIKTQVREYMVAFLLLQTMVVGSFASLDMLLFYFFFEGSLIPMFLIIGIWGGENRIYAAMKFFLYTLLGSVLLLLALLYIYFQLGTTDIPTLLENVPSFSAQVQMWLWLAFFASFAVKVPMWPAHTWLPDAHVQAPTAGSVMLAGVLLKLGGYGFVRFSLPMLPDASVEFTPLIYGLSVIAVIYTSLVALMQKDMKKMIAYSSVAHMGYVTVGLFAQTRQAMEGAIFQMISHGVVSAALFMCVGVLYDRVHTKEIAKYGGVAARMPRFALLFMVFTMASVGLPATSGFVGEFLVIAGVFQASTWVSLLIATGVVLGAAYMLWLYKRVMFGELKKPLSKLHDVTTLEWIAFLPLVLLTLLLGIYPSIVLDYLHMPVEQLMQHIRFSAGG